MCMCIRLCLLLLVLLLLVVLLLVVVVLLAILLLLVVVVVVLLASAQRGLNSRWRGAFLEPTGTNITFHYTCFWTLVFVICVPPDF